MTKPKDSVLGDLYACFLTKTAIPKELSDAFVERYLRGRNGEVRSWDEVLANPTRYGTERKHQAPDRAGASLSQTTWIV